MELSKRFIPN